MITPVLWRAESQVNTTDAAVGIGGVAFQFDGQVVGLAADGGYVVVWTDVSRAFNPNGTAVIGQRYDALGERVGGEFRISQFNSGDQFSPAVTALSDGDVAVAFVHQFAGDNDIYVRKFDPSLNIFVTDFIDEGANNTVDPSITAFAAGGYVVSYTVGTGADTDIAARIVGGDMVGAQFFIDNQLDNRNFSELATLSNGNFVAVYQDEDDGADNDILFRIMTSTGASTGPIFLVPGADNGGVEETDPDVAALTGGGFVVVWTDAGSSVTDIRASILTNAGVPGASSMLVNTSTAGAQNEASVVALADGGFLVTWEDDSANLVRGQRFDAVGNEVGSEFTVRSGVSTDSPEAALLSDGRIAYAIGDVSTGDFDVVTSIFDPGPPPPPGDVLWRHFEGMAATADNFLGSVPTTWQIRGIGDFDADGDADILWRNNDGFTVNWELAGGDYLVNHNLPNVPTTWQTRGMGDFDNDGDSDILWRHNDGTLTTWEMEDGDFVTNHNLPSVPNTWHTMGTGDFDGDGDSDILWRNDDGAVVTWEMEAGAYWVNHNLPSVPTTYQISGTGDFDGDGDSDILWRNDDGAVVTWEMEAGAYFVNHNLPIVPTTYQIRGTEDFDSDGDSDILWRHDSGQVVTWEIEDGAFVASHDFGVVSNGWQIAGTGEFDLV